jgi:hypothetical protein
MGENTEGQNAAVRSGMEQYEVVRRSKEKNGAEGGREI